MMFYGNHQVFMVVLVAVHDPMFFWVLLIPILMAARLRGWKRPGWLRGDHDRYSLLEFYEARLTGVENIRRF